MSEIFQEKLIRGNLIRGKEDIKIQDSAKAIQRTSGRLIRNLCVIKNQC